MTDEEMAEERATKFADINFNEPDNYGNAKEVGHFSYHAGFLAGLEAGKEIECEYVKNHAVTFMREHGLFPFGKWHKVADGDLPEYVVEVLDENGDKVRYEREGYAGCSGQLPSLSGWIAYSEYEERDVEIDTPVAWCEIPKYTEEPEKNNPQLLKHGTIEVDPVTETFLRGR